MDYAMIYYTGRKKLEKNITLGLGEELPRMNDIISIPVDGEVTIGSDPSSYIVIEDETIDRQHAKVVFNPDVGDSYLENLSQNHVLYLNGKVIQKRGDKLYLTEDSRIHLFNRDIILLSKKGYSFIFETKTE